MGNPSSPTLSSNCENRRAFFCQTSPGMHVWGVLVPIRTVFYALKSTKKPGMRQKPSPVFLATLLSRWTTLKQRGKKGSVAHTTTPKKPVCIRVACNCFCDSWRKVKAENEAERSDYQLQKSTVCWRPRKRQGKRNMTRTRERTEGLQERSSSTILPSRI